MAGYSGTPLPRKLGIKEAHRVLLIAAPDDFEESLVPLPDGVVLKANLRGVASFNVIVFFSKSKAKLLDRLPAIIQRLEVDGGLWIAWPKKASGMVTDLSDGEVRAIGLGTGLVDNKVCAIDETWSALRFVRRIKDRK